MIEIIHLLSMVNLYFLSLNSIRNSQHLETFEILFLLFLPFQIGTEPSDNQYLVVDIGLGALPSLMIGNCGPHDILVKRKPPRHLLSFIQIFSIISFLFFQTCCYVIMWYYLKMQPW